MNWRQTMYDRKGFLHHHETPAEDKLFYAEHKVKAIRLLDIAECFLRDDGVRTQRSISRGKDQLGAMSRNLHRGVYCPSPVLDILITNSKRGKILVRPSEKSRITNRYIYDTAGKLIIADNYTDNKMISSEYLLYQDCFVYGITIGMSGRLVCVSEEQYQDRRLVSYICAYYSEEGNKAACYQMDCELFRYDDLGLMDWDYYQLHYGWENIAPSGFVKHNRYRFVRKDGHLHAFYRVNIDGTPLDESFLSEIKGKRKL